MNNSLPDSLKDFMTKRVETDAHGTPSSYIRNLIIKDKKAASREHLEALLLEGLNSGPTSPLESSDFDDIRANVSAKLEANAKKHDRRL